MLTWYSCRINNGGSSVRFLFNGKKYVQKHGNSYGKLPGVKQVLVFLIVVKHDLPKDGSKQDGIKRKGDQQYIGNSIRCIWHFFIVLFLLSGSRTRQ